MRVGTEAYLSAMSMTSWAVVGVEGVAAASCSARATASWRRSSRSTARSGVSSQASSTHLRKANTACSFGSCHHHTYKVLPPYMQRVFAVLCYKPLKL